MILTLISAIFLVIAVPRAWNGLAFNDFGERLGVFVMFSAGFLSLRKPKSFDDPLTIVVLALAVHVLLAPTVISYFVP